MNIRKFRSAIVILLSSLFTLHLSAQELTLDKCKQMARDNYPAIRQYGLIEQSRDLTLSNAAKAWLPGVSVTGFGVAMTDVLEASPLGEMKNTMYGASLSVSQVLYDGGAIGAQRRVARAKSQVDEAQIEVQLYNVNERVEQLFFGILMIDEQIKQVGLLQENLGISEKTVRSMMSSGLANQSDHDQVQVNQIQAEQQLVNLKTMRKAYETMLKSFIGDPLLSPEERTPSNSPLKGEELKLVKPDLTVVSFNSSPLRGGQEGSFRPELLLFASQENLLSSQRKALDSQLMPTLSAFGMASYHNKLMPIVKDRNLMAGLMLKWNIGALYTRKNDLASLKNQQLQIDVQRETFLFNNNLQQQQSNGQIENLRQQMALDDKAVALRESILEKARKKVEMGTETVNELLRDVNAVTEARQQKAVHEIQLLQEINKLNTIKAQ